MSEDIGGSTDETTGNRTGGTREATGGHTGEHAGRGRPAATPSPPRLRCGPSQGPLFTYGTLQFDAVLRALLGRIPRRTADSAPGWRAAALGGRLYPGLVPAHGGAAARGLLVTGLSDEEWAVLDAFEDEEYELREVALASGRTSWTYVWAAGDVLEEDWDAGRFADRHLPAYAARCADELRTG